MSHYSTGQALALPYRLPAGRASSPARGEGKLKREQGVITLFFTLF